MGHGTASCPAWGRSGEGSSRSEVGVPAAFWQHRVASPHRHRDGDSSVAEKASLRATSCCMGIFWKPPSAALAAQTPPGTSGSESLAAACNYPADKSTNAALRGEVATGRRLKIDSSLPGCLAPRDVPGQLARPRCCPSGAPSPEHPEGPQRRRAGHRLPCINTRSRSLLRLQIIA